jgi:hypothetical protein
VENRGNYLKILENFVPNNNKKTFVSLTESCEKNIFDVKAWNIKLKWEKLYEQEHGSEGVGRGEGEGEGWGGG